MQAQPMITVLRAAGAALAVALAAPAAWAQAYPSKPITLVVPFPAGGATDVQARALAKAAGAELKQTIVVVNHAGVAGTLGPATAARQAAADGYTLIQTPGTLFRQPHLQKVSFDPLKDFTYIMGVTSYTHGVVVREDARWKDLKELLAYAKANPGKVSYGTAGRGSTSHVAMERLAKAAGVEFNYVPFKGAAEVFNAVLGGHIDVAPEAGFGAVVDGGKARVVAVFEESRLKNRPAVPTVKETGYDIVLAGNYGIGAPKGLDPAIVRTLHDAFRKALDDPEFSRILEQQGQRKTYMDSKAYTDFAARSYADEKRSIAELKIVLE